LPDGTSEKFPLTNSRACWFRHGRAFRLRQNDLVRWDKQNDAIACAKQVRIVSPSIISYVKNPLRHAGEYTRKLLAAQLKQD